MFSCIFTHWTMYLKIFGFAQFSKKYALFQKQMKCHWKSSHFDTNSFRFREKYSFFSEKASKFWLFCYQQISVSEISPSVFLWQTNRGGIDDDMMWDGFQYLCPSSRWMCFSLIDGRAFDFYADLPSALLHPDAGPSRPIFQLHHSLPQKQN